MAKKMQIRSLKSRRAGSLTVYLNSMIQQRKLNLVLTTKTQRSEVRRGSMPVIGRLSKRFYLIRAKT